MSTFPSEIRKGNAIYGGIVFSKCIWKNNRICYIEKHLLKKFFCRIVIDNYSPENFFKYSRLEI